MTRRFARKLHSLRFVAVFIATFSLLALLAAPAAAQNPVPFIDQPLVPDATAPGGAAFTLTLNGAGFVASSTVNWNGSPLATTFVSSSQLTATVPASDIAEASTASITVVSPSPGGGVSNTMYFSIVVPNTSAFPLAPGFYAAGTSPGESVAMADLNGDGKPDIVVANVGCVTCGDGSMSVLLGNGNGTFETFVAYDSGGVFTNAEAIADVNGDGIPDLIAVNNYGECSSGDCDGSVAVLLGNGDGTFRPAVTYDVPAENPDAIAVADINGDGKLDLIVGILNSGVAVMLGNGNGTFQPALLYSNVGNIFSVAIADVNHDGKLDLLAAGIIGGQPGVNVLLGNGDGTFQPAVAYSSGAPSGYFASSVVAADLSGDGNLDLVVANYTGDMGVLRGNGDGTFQPVFLYSSGGLAGSAAVADMNGDARLDVVVSNLTGSSPGSVGMLLGNGDGTFQPVVNFGALSGWQVAIADVNGDGRPDLVVTGGYDVVAVLLNSIRAATTTTLISSAYPVGLNRNVFYTATVVSQSGATPSGTVTFQDGGVTVATVGMDRGRATCRTSYAVEGVHLITAVYSGDANNAGSTSAVLTEQARDGRFPSETVMATSGSPSFVGQPVTLTATVTSIYGAIPNGELVTFRDDGAVIGTTTTAAGIATFTTSSLTARTHTLKATYDGDEEFAQSSGTVTQVVGKCVTATALVASLNPAVYGQSVTWTATVSSNGPNPPTGPVYFVGLGYAPSSGGVATLTKEWLNAGTYAITAEYKGDADSAASASSVLNQVVNPASTTTVITSSADPSTLGQNVTFTATVTSSTGVHATGTVTFTAGVTVLGTVPLDGTVATFSTAALPVASFEITATYNGTTDFTGSSDSLIQSIQP
ncbi:MAG: Ig-like domain repeat protein [Candidatus Sulfotelmatobacter sp.]